LNARWDRQAIVRILPVFVMWKMGLMVAPQIITGWWFGTLILFSIIYGIILPIDHFSRWLKPPNT